MGYMRNAFKVLVGRHEGNRPMGDLGIDRRILLKWILKKLVITMWNEFIWFRIRSSGGII
jgi:hypothetical protein